jgi:hypothetical protein
MNCNHTTIKYDIIRYHDWEGNEIVERVPTEYYAWEDIDLHRCKCTQCGKIEYYSKAAQDYYELGIKSNINGLDK